MTPAPQIPLSKPFPIVESDKLTLAAFCRSAACPGIPPASPDQTYTGIIHISFAVHIDCLRPLFVPAANSFRLSPPYKTRQSRFTCMEAIRITRKPAKPKSLNGQAFPMFSLLSNIHQICRQQTAGFHSPSSKAMRRASRFYRTTENMGHRFPEATPRPYARRQTGIRHPWQAMSAHATALPPSDPVIDYNTAGLCCQFPLSNEDLPWQEGKTAKGRHEKSACHLSKPEYTRIIKAFRRINALPSPVSRNMLTVCA